MPQVTYADAINLTLHQVMQDDPRVLLIGQGVTSPWYVGGTTVGLFDRFGPDRVVDTPVSENGVTGVAIGAALAGMRPVLVHPRMDFLYYAMDQIANHAANWYYMFGGQLSVPLTIWAIINRGREQAAQHSQALHGVLTHIPGLRVAAPSTPKDASGLLAASIADDNPVVYLDDRWLYNERGTVPKEPSAISLGKGVVRRKGSDVTVVASSYMAREAQRAAESLEARDIEVELLDLRCLRPLDVNLLISSVRKTGRVVIADGGWRTCGFGAELCALVVEKAFAYLKAPPVRVSLPDVPAPASIALERAYYPDASTIAASVEEVLSWGDTGGA